MPDNKEPCAWCGRRYGEHSMGRLKCVDLQNPNRFVDTTTFASYGTITVSQVPLGTRVELYLNARGEIADHITTATIVGTLYQGNVTIAVGWVDRQDAKPINAWSESKHSTLKWGWYVTIITPIHRVVPDSIMVPTSKLTPVVVPTPMAPPAPAAKPFDFDAYNSILPGRRK